MTEDDRYLNEGKTAPAFGVRMIGVACLLFFATTLLSTDARKLPSFIKPCSPRRPDWNQCLLRAVEDIRPHLSQGIPEMRIPKMEPLLVSSAALDSGNFLAVFENLNLYGLVNFKVRHVDFDFERNVAKINVDFDKVDIYGDYRVKGRVLILDVNGSGRVNGTLLNPKATATLRGSRKIVKGKEYLSLDKIDVDVIVTDGKLYFAEVFKGNPELTENTNKVVNENIRDILSDLQPVINKTIGEIVLMLVRQVFDRYSIDELFPSK